MLSCSFNYYKLLPQILEPFSAYLESISVSGYRSKKRRTISSSAILEAGIIFKKELQFVGTIRRLVYILISSETLLKCLSEIVRSILLVVLTAVEGKFFSYNVQICRFFCDKIFETLIVTVTMCGSLCLLTVKK